MSVEGRDGWLGNWVEREVGAPGCDCCSVLGISGSGGGAPIFWRLAVGRGGMGGYMRWWGGEGGVVMRFMECVWCWRVWCATWQVYNKGREQQKNNKPLTHCRGCLIDLLFFIFLVERNLFGVKYNIKYSD